MPPNQQKQSFGATLRFFRGQTIDTRSGKPLSQEMFGYRVSEISGLHITRNTVNNWENSKSYLDAERDRHLLLAITKVLLKYAGIKNLEQANQVLEAGGFRTLDPAEAASINPAWTEQFNETRSAQTSWESVPVNQIPTGMPPINIHIGEHEHVPGAPRTAKSPEHERVLTHLVDGLANLFAKVLFAILDVVPEWLTEIRFRHGVSRSDPSEEKEIQLINPACGNEPIDLKQQRLKISAAFGSYFTGLLEREHSYCPIDGQIRLSLPSSAPKLEPFQQIYWSMQHTRGPEVLLIAGEGGMGKSTLATKIIRCLYHANAVDLLLGDSAKSRVINPVTGAVSDQPAEYDDTDSFLKKVSNQLGLEYSPGETKRQEALRKIKDRLEGRRSILVMDNLETVHGGADVLHTCLRLVGRDTRILITTRNISGITDQTAGIFLVRLNPIQEARAAKKFLQWHINTHSRGHPHLNRLLPDLEDHQNVHRLLEKTGGIPLLMQLVLSDIARTTWSRLEALPSLFGPDLLHFLYHERWMELGEMSQSGMDARALLIYISKRTHRDKISYENLLYWGRTTRGLMSIDEPLRILEERFLIVNSDRREGNYSIFPSLADFLKGQSDSVPSR